MNYLFAYHIPMKKALLVVLLAMAVFFFSACGKIQTDEISVTIKQGADPVDQVNAIQSKLAELFLNYRSAQL